MRETDKFISKVPESNNVCMVKDTKRNVLQSNFRRKKISSL